MTIRAPARLSPGMLLLAMQALSHAAESTGHITGIGGIFVKAKDPKALDPERNKIELWEPRRPASPTSP